MKFAETELWQITEDTWRTVLGEKIEPPAASAMFALDSVQPTGEDVHAAMCELVSIVAGNVKVVLSGFESAILPDFGQK